MRNYNKVEDRIAEQKFQVNRKYLIQNRLTMRKVLELLEKQEEHGTTNESTFVMP